MLIKTNISKIFIVIIVMILIITLPKISTNGVLRGLHISTNVIIPSLFPFMVCILMLIKSRVNLSIDFINNALYKCFGQNFTIFFVFIMSLLGGYPTGAVMIAELYKDKQINTSIANIMLTYCVNAGPAFIIFIVGNAFNSNKIGLILFIANMSSSILLSIIYSKKLKIENVNDFQIFEKTKNFFEIFFESVSEACESIIRISAFIVFFSVINSYLEYFFINMPILSKIQYFTEVTHAVQNCKNLYFVSFLLSFSGISIWCQIFALLKNIKINKKRFLISRILHGIISVIITYLCVNIFNIKIYTFYNNVNFESKILYTDVSLLISMIIMVLVFFITIFYKNNSGKFINDML